MLSKSLMAASGGGGAWDIETMVFNGTPVNSFFDPDHMDDKARGNFFKPDGTKLYITPGTSTDRIVYEYDLPTPWDITTAVYVQTGDVSAAGYDSVGIFFSPDGLNMYTCGGDRVYQFSLPTAWDVSTVNYIRAFVSNGSPQSVVFSPDGIKMYTIRPTFDVISEYTLSTAWDISTATFVFQLNISSLDSEPTGLAFKPDGTSMYFTGWMSDKVFQYNLSTAWDLSTNTFVNSQFVSSQAGVPQSINFKPDGTEMYVQSRGNAIYRYTITTPWSTITRVYTNPTTNFRLNYTNTYQKAVAFNPEGTVMITSGNFSNRIYPWDLSTPWAVETAVPQTSYFVVSSSSNNNGIRFSADGGKFYVVSGEDDTIIQYDAATPWSLSGLTFIGVFSVNAQAPNPQGVFFKTDGTKMYVVGDNSDAVHEYSLSTPGDVLTSVFVQSFSVATETTQPFDVFFRDNGLSMYISGTGRVNQYALSTAWDISTAAFVKYYITKGLMPFPQGMLFRPDGKQLFLISASAPFAVVSYDLG